MKRRVGFVVGVVAVVVVFLLCLRHRETDSPPGRPFAVEHSLTKLDVGVDPRTQTRGAISGAVRDETRAAIAGARVCADAVSAVGPGMLIREPFCATTDDQGRYKIGGLLAAGYVVGAVARQFRPTVFRPSPGSASLAISIAAGEERAGVDIVLRRGGVEVTGVVLDLAGGAVAHALVRASSTRRGLYGAAVEADEQGRFTLWVEPGPIWLAASADGYAPGVVPGRAPGAFEILLTPESSLAGTVIDAASGEPVEGARVAVASTSPGNAPSITAISDAQGRFRVERLSPNRYIASAVARHRYGRSAGSVLVGLAQHVDGVTIKLFPAHRVAGKIAISSTREVCPEGYVELSDSAHDRAVAALRGPDGEYIAEGVLPGTYQVGVSCRGYMSRSHYEPVVVADADVTGLVWEVDGGARIRGKVVTSAGVPVEGAKISGRYVSGPVRDPVNGVSDTSRPDGAFELAGLAAGTYRVDVQSEQGVAPRDGYAIDVAPAAVIERDLVLEGGGTLTGAVVDSAGKPIGDAVILAMPVDRSWSIAANSVNSDAAGAFRFEALRAGDYRVTASRRWGDVLRKPGTTDDAPQGEKVAVRAGQVATVRLVVEARDGTIRGVVVDASGKAAPDAFVSWSRESDAAGSQRSSTSDTRDDWWGGATPVLTSTDGSFMITQLSPGTYTLRAFRKGGGEAVAEHVAVGASVKLQIKPTASIEGTARRARGSPPDELKISLSDRKTGFEREEVFYMSGGRFAINDLPAGHFDITVTGDGSQKAATVDLGEGERKLGVDVVLDPLITVTGRLVEHGTQQPVAGMYVFAEAARITTSATIDLDRGILTDETGRFSVPDVPAGQVGLRGIPREGPDSKYPSFYVVRIAVGAAVVDLGDIDVVRRRNKRGEAIGELGLRFVEQPDDTPADQRAFQISWIDPEGPAAKTALRTGDIITSCDGIDVTGPNSTRWPALVSAPPGTILSLATRRGPVVTLALASP